MTTVMMIMSTMRFDDRSETSVDKGMRLDTVTRDEMEWHSIMIEIKCKH